MRESDVSSPERQGASAGRRARLTIAGISAVLCLGATACQASPAATRSPAGGGQPQAPAKPSAQLSISPGGRRDSNTNAGIAVSVANGQLTSVTVSAGAGNHPVPGAMSSDGSSWHTLWALHNSTRYTVKASAKGADGATVTKTTSFRTAAAAATFTASTFEGYHQTYGVGMPIMINFSQPIVHRRAVERAIEVKTSKPVVGAWMWDGNQTLDFRTRNYWPQHTRVSFVAHFQGVEGAPGVYGATDLSQSFDIGNSLIVVASTSTHYMKVYYRNKRIGNWPISTGMPGDDTANGTYLTIEKANPTRMVGNGYNVLVPLAVRFTWSGNYIHWAAWSVAQQGIVNVSHGCVNISPAHAAIYYRLANPGDPVNVVSSPVAGKWDDGWTEWFLSWNQVLRDSALHLAVEAGPHGSEFVSPSSLPAPPPYSLLNRPRRNNYLAQ